MNLSPACVRYWQGYLGQLRAAGDQRVPNVIASYAGSPEITDQLIDLYLAGTKTAGSGLVEDYASAGDPLPEVGDHWIALGGDGEPRCILRTDQVEIHTFKDVPERVAVAEGEGDLTLEYWRRVHSSHYSPHLREWEIDDIEESNVVTEFFAVVFPAAPPA